MRSSLLGSMLAMNSGVDGFSLMARRRQSQGIAMDLDSSIKPSPLQRE
jgi:hypothetical protein